MKENCKHHNIKVVEETAFDKVGICEDCGIEVPIMYLKEGLYAVQLKEETYLMNLSDEMSLDEKGYRFTVRGTKEEFCIYKENENNYENVSGRQLCKNMKNL